MELGPHLIGRVVCIKAGNLRVLAALARVREAMHLRDHGTTVRQLLEMGFTVTEIQRDDSSQLCTECFRPRQMCSCTYDLMKPE